eukprot:g13089.t1
MIKGYDERHTKATPAEASSAQRAPGERDAWGVTRGEWGGGGGGGGEGGASWAYQAHEPDSAEVGQGRGHGHEGDATDKDQAKQLLVRLGIADKTDDFTMNAKVYVVNLIKRFL